MRFIFGRTTITYINIFCIFSIGDCRQAQHYPIPNYCIRIIEETLKLSACLKTIRCNLNSCIACPFFRYIIFSESGQHIPNSSFTVYIHCVHIAYISYTYRMAIILWLLKVTENFLMYGKQIKCSSNIK